MSNYTRERVQLNQLLDILSSQEYYQRKLRVIYSTHDDKYFVSCPSLDGFIDYNLVTQKNELRTFKSMKALFSALNIRPSLDISASVSNLIFV